MKLKVLPLSPTMDLEFYDDDDKPMFFNSVKGDEINPVFNRPGIYKYGNLCWFETGNLAYRYNSAQFNYKLNIFHISELDIKQYRALKDVVEHKLATKEQKEMMHLYQDWLRMKKSQMDIKKYMRKWF